MISLDLKEHGSTINAILSSLSSQADTVKIKFSQKNNRIELNALDKATNIDIVAFFNTPSTIEKTQIFAIPADKLKAIFSKRSAIEFELNNNTFTYQYPADKKSPLIKGKLETESYNSSFKYPDTLKSNNDLTKELFDYYEAVKLKAVFDTREMLLYARYIANSNILQISSATNFHLSLLQVKTELGNSDFSLTLPFKYLDLAKKFAHLDNNKISFVNNNKNTFFFTTNVAFSLPEISNEGSKINIDSIINNVELIRSKSKGSLVIDPKEIYDFMNNALAIKEKDRFSDIVFSLKNDKLVYYIETSHGLMESSTNLKKTVENRIKTKVNCAGLYDLLTKTSDIDTELMLTDNGVVLEQRSKDKTFTLLTYGVS